MHSEDNGSPRGSEVGRSLETQAGGYNPTSLCSRGTGHKLQVQPDSHSEMVPILPLTMAREMEHHMGSDGDSRNPNLPAKVSPVPWYLTAASVHVQGHASQGGNGGATPCPRVRSGAEGPFGPLPPPSQRRSPCPVRKTMQVLWAAREPLPQGPQGSAGGSQRR